MKPFHEIQSSVVKRGYVGSSQPAVTAQTVKNGQNIKAVKAAKSTKGVKGDKHKCDKCKHKCHKDKHGRTYYDVIVIGAGTAGACVAKRVSDDFNLSVLLLEQGRDENENDLVKQPFEFNVEQQTLNLFSAAVNPKTSDNLYNINFLGGPGGVYDQQTLPIHSGCGNGGASNHCYLECIRSSPGYHTFMQQYAGDEAARWGPEGAYQSYIDLETYGGPPDTPFRGYSGPFNLFQNEGNNELATQILESAGLASNSPLDNALPISEPGDATDYNNKVDLSLMRQFQYYLNPDFTREHSGHAFLGADVLLPATPENPLTKKGVGNRRLTEEMDAVVDRVIFHKSCKGRPRKVKAVVYIQNGQSKIAYVRHKVVVSCGGLRSAGVLERSGIGSLDVLKEANVKEVVFENPNVGEYLNSGIGNGCVISVEPTLWETVEQVHCMLKLVDTENPYPGWVRRFHIGHYPGLFPPVEPTNALLKSVGASINGVNNVLSAGWNEQPTSFGSVHIINALPHSMPKLWFPVLSTEEDRLMQREYYKFMKRLETNMNTNYPDSQYQILYPPVEAYAGYPDAPEIVFKGSIVNGVLTVTEVVSGELALGMTVLGDGVIVGSQIVEFDTGSGAEGTYFLSYQQDVEEQTFTGDFLDMYAGSFNVILDHYSSTCRMGDLVSQDGVVDGRLHVHGVSGLMVADNSIYPIQTDAGVMPAILAGWKAADIILEDLA
jgi:choline dehydrogenase